MKQIFCSLNHHTWFYLIFKNSGGRKENKWKELFPDFFLPLKTTERQPVAFEIFFLLSLVDRRTFDQGERWTARHEMGGASSKISSPPPKNWSSSQKPLVDRAWRTCAVHRSLNSMNIVLPRCCWEVRGVLQLFLPQIMEKDFYSFRDNVFEEDQIVPDCSLPLRNSSPTGPNYCYNWKVREFTYSKTR